jgi:hypothetical protein
MRKSTNLVVKSRLALLFYFPTGFSATKQRVRKANSKEKQVQIEYRESQTVLSICDEENGYGTDNISGFKKWLYGLAHIERYWISYRGPSSRPIIPAH